MTPIVKNSKLREKAARKQDKRLKKKAELAEHALQTLRELGYANTSLRDIAEQSNVSVGTLHYYFEDKNDLILYCVDVYKDRFLAGIFEIIEQSSTPEELTENYIQGLTRFILQFGEIHRLWYDIRNQAMFDETFVESVAEIEGEFLEICASLLEGMEKTGSNPVDFYIMVDGIYRYYLQQHLFGAEVTEDMIRSSVMNLLGKI